MEKKHTNKQRNPLSRLEFTTRVRKRAEYEAFEYTLTTEGIRVRNCSHADPANHEYTISVEDGLPTECTCPADARFEGACKHRVAVAIRRPILDAAETQVAADGGRAFDSDDQSAKTAVEREEHRETGPSNETHTAEEAATEECEDCLSDFPCWECVRTGRKEIPE